MKKLLLFAAFSLFLLPFAVMGQCGKTIVAEDAEKSYPSLKVGPHCWMQYNLSTKVDGSKIYKSDMYPDTNANLSVYGRLYNWYAAMNVQPGQSPVVGEHGFVQGVCPEGWHLPIDVEVSQLMTNSTPSLHDVQYWLIPGTNTTTYTMRPGGYYNTEKNYGENLCGNSFMWTAQSLDENNPLVVWSDCHCDHFVVDKASATDGMSVRCVYKIYQGKVTTDSATNITKNSATLYGTVAFNGFDESYERGFAYGTDPSNLDQWVVENPAASEETIPFNKEITGLTVATKYYYQAYIVNDFDTAWGEIKEFSTLKMEVTTDSANNITHYEATLHGNLIHSGYTSVNVGFKYGTSEDALTSVVANADPMTAIGKFHCDITGLTANTQYYYKAFAANGTDTVYGEVKNFTTTGSSFTCGTSKVKDVDNNEYNTVQIGNQCWMKENLRTTKKPNSVAITEGMWKPGSNPVETYGRLYSWTTMMNGATSSEATPSGVQGICPNGWHVPSDAEWTQLTSYVCNSTNPNYKCTGCSSSQSPECIAKALASATGWKSDNTNCCAVGNAQASNNATGFSAVPAGDYYGGTYNDFGSIAYFWSATQGSYGGAYRRGLSYDYAYVGKYNASKSEGYSVRCLRNPEALMVTVTFQPNGAMGTMENQTVTSGVATPLNANAFNRATAPETDRNWAFIGWNTKADGTGVSFADQANVTFDSDTTLYAQWHTWCTGTPKTSVNEFGTSRIDSLKDVDNNKYTVVQIGTQCWMKQNLRTFKNTKDTGNIYTPTTDEEPGYDVAIYGRLYDWDAVMQGAASSETTPSNVQGICPTGWHVPSDTEWTQLTDYVGSQSEYVCGSDNRYIANALSTTMGWNSSISSGCNAGNSGDKSNATGFSAVPAGGYYGYYNGFGNGAYFWSATQGSSLGAYHRYLSYYDTRVSRYNDYKRARYSVRCLRDPEAPVQTVTVTFQPNGAMGTMENQTVTSGVATPLNANAFNRATAPETDRNWAFIGWNTKADGTGVSFANQANVTFDSDTTLYAQWHTWCTGTPKTSVNEFGTSRIDSVKDGEDNKYTVVQIGNQCWMKQNLRTANVNDKGTVYTNDADGYNVNIYGRLYDWAAAMQVAGANEKKIDVELPHQGICPTGWHVPSDAELDTLTTYVNNEANGYRCNGYENIANALSAAMGWDNREIQGCYAGSNSITRNLTGFSAVPAGYHQNSTFSEFGSYAGFWSTTQDDAGKNADYLELDSHTSGVTLFGLFKTDGHSVRCLRDPEALMVTVTFQPNGAMGTMESQSVTSGVATQLKANAFNRDNAPEKDRNWAFIGWNTKADGTGVSFADQANVTFDSDTTLYAQWHTWCTGTPKTSVNEFGTSRIDSVKDVDNNKYTVVQIGTQCWMKQNLRTTKYANGTSIDLGSSTSTTWAYRYYTNGDSSNVGTYGYLYNWIAAVQGICPVGWHVPSDAEFDTLTKYVFSIDDYKCGESCDIWQAQSKVSCIAKALAFTSDWGSEAEASTCAVGSNLSANNATGFSAVPAGSYKYGDFGYTTSFWSASQVFGDVYAYCRGLIFNVAHVSCGKHRMSYGFSVRCVRDAEAPVQTVTVTFQPNGAMGTMESQSVTSGVATPLNANAFNRDNAPETDKNWAFIGWNTKADGTGVSFADQANVTFDSDTTLYAQWHTWCTGTPKTSVNEFGTSRIDSLKDVDNNKYTVVQIGTQCWMKENLRTTKYADGTSISFGGTTTSVNTAYRYFPKNDTTNVSTYGHLYNWTAVTKGASTTYPKSMSDTLVHGICPTGWHVPSDSEWTQLTDYVNKEENGYRCDGYKTIANALSTTTGWNSSISSGCNAGNSGDKSNATGFAAVPAGDCNYSNFGNIACFGSATQNTSYFAYYRFLFYDNAYVVRRDNDNKYDGFSVRCLRDSE